MFGIDLETFGEELLFASGEDASLFLAKSILIEASFFSSGLSWRLVNGDNGDVHPLEGGLVLGDGHGLNTEIERNK